MPNRRPDRAGPTGSILLVANYESDVGYAWWLMERFWSLIAAAVSEQGRPCLLAYPVLRTVPDVVARAPIEIVEFRFAHRSWGDLWKGLRFIRQHGITSVYLTDWPYFHVAYALWRCAGVRRVVIHDHSPGDRPPLTGARAWMKDILQRTRLFAATHYVAVSPYIQQRLRENCRVPASRCVTVTNGITPLTCAADRRPDVRRRLSLDDDAIVIVLVSRATRYKNLDFAVRCVARLIEDPDIGHAVQAIHCGDGPDLESFRELAGQLGIADRFRFLGRRDDVREILCASDIAFHPSRGEAMSLAILEFMSAGLAVLTSDLPSVSTAIEAGRTGMTYERDNEASAVAALRRLIAEPDSRASMGSAAAEAVRRDFTQETMDRAFFDRVIPLLSGR